MASGFQHDAQGFLIGEVIENGRDLMRVQQQGIAIWKTVRSDVKAIARAVGAQVATNVRVSRPSASPRAPAGGQRTLGGNYIGGPRQTVAQPAGRSAPARRAGSSSPRAQTSVVIAQPRGANGRFVAAGQRPAGGNGGAGGGGGGAPAGGGGKEGSSGGAFKRMNETLGKLATSLQAADNIDPTVNALKEVKDVVTPLGRGLFSIFGKSAERKKEVWYRRFLKALTPTTQKAQQQTGGGGGFFGIGGGGGLGGGLLGGALGAAGGLLGSLFGKGKGLLKGGGKLLGRTPLLGALVAGGGALASIFGGRTRDEKYKGVGEAGGMLSGGMAGASLGAAIGTAILPGIGTAIGGFLGGVGGSLLGEKFGAKVGEWTKTLVDSDIPGKVIEGWNVTTAAIGATWDSLAGDAKTAWADITTKAGEWLDTAKAGLDAVGSTLSDAGNAVNDWIKAKTGIDVKGAVGSAVNDVKNVAGNAWSATKDFAAQAGSSILANGKAGLLAITPNTAKRAYAAGAAAAEQAKAGYDVARGTENTTATPAGAIQRGARSAGGSLGEMIAKGEGGYGSFNRGVAGDARGATMDFSNMTVADIMAAQALPKGDANRLFAVGRYQVIPATLKSAVGAMGLSGNEQFTPELQERIFAEYLTDKKRPEIAGYIKGGHDNLAAAQRAGSREWASIADPSTGKSYYAGSAGNAASLSAGAFGGSLTDARDKYKSLVTAGVDSKTAYAAVVGGPSLPSVASANIPSSVPPTIPKAVTTDDRLAQIANGPGAGRGTINVTIPETLSQNVGDRGMAHIVTGGLGGS